MLRKLSFFLLAILAVLGMVTPALAQDSTTVVDGLNFPRGIVFDEEGNLYITEAGSGGEKVLLEVDESQITGGLTSQITVVAPDGSTSVAVANFASAFVPFEGASLGLIRAVPNGDLLWLVLSDAQNLTVFSDAVVAIDINTHRVVHYIDLFAIEAANNPVNLTDGTEEVLSNPSDLAFSPDGTLYIVDTGANVLFSWTEEAGLTMIHAWTENPVPTSIEFADNGEFYIGFLGQGLAPGAGRIEHWSADGSELIETFPGLTNVTDILLDADGNLYASQMVVVGDTGPQPDSGSVVLVTADGATPVLEGLNSPYGLAQDAEGNLLVATNSAFAEPGKGAVLKIALGE
jgi:hypothetical protein